MKVKEESEKNGLKLNIQKTKVMASGPIPSWKIDGETVETVTGFIFWANKSLQMVTTAMKLKQCGDSSKKLEIEVPYDPAIPLLGIHTEETRIERDTCTPMFISALFIMARTWKQPRCPSADKWIRKLWYIYTMEYYSAIKKNKFESVLMRWMKLEPIIQSEVSQKEKLQYRILTHIYGI